MAAQYTASLTLYTMSSKSTGAGGKFIRSSGSAILSFCPYLLKTLTIVGTAAMCLVGGGIPLHGIPGSHDLVHHIEVLAAAMPMVGAALAPLSSFLLNALVVSRRGLFWWVDPC